MKTMIKFVFLTLFLKLTVIICTPDCYNFTEGITKKWNDYNEKLPPSLKGYRADWMTIKPGKNCAFYTFYDVYFNSLN